jgi:hypothetical protein
LNLSARATFANDNKQRREHKMKAAAGKRNGHKRNHSRTARAKFNTLPKARAVPLNASPEATRKQDLQRKPRDAHLQRRANGGMALCDGFDVMGLMNRRTKAFLALPARIAACRSPFEAWREQTLFMQESFIDCAHHVMINLLGAASRAAGPAAWPISRAKWPDR